MADKEIKKDDRLLDGKPADPIEMLKEIEAFLTFKLIEDNPTIPLDDIKQMREDITECLQRNGQ